METGAESRTGSETEMEVESEVETESRTGTGTGTGTESGTWAEYEYETEIETESSAETDSDMEVVSKPTERKYYSSTKPICKLSDPAQPHTLKRWLGHPFSSECFSCKGPIFMSCAYNYYCVTCHLDFHRGCHHYPPEIRHPFHLQHPLTFTLSSPQTRPDFRLPVLYRSSYTKSSRFDCSSDDNDSDSRSGFSVLKCRCCQRILGDAYYACSICAFTLHLSCAKFSPSLTINHPKAHDHTLTLLPRRNPSPCDACGLSLCRQSDPVYACLPCNYMVHRKCIKLPRVIKITRHPHRIAYTSSLPPLDFSCGFCRRSVDINCGQYSCTVGCLYSVHSKCATRKDVWDGKELEGVPLEEEDIPPFTRIDDQTIHHFNHEHYLRFHGNDGDYDIREEIKLCQACILPILYDPFYSCMQCNFVLHEACANRSLKIHHPLHIHPLSLVLTPLLPQTFRCSACRQRCLGFVYKCCEKDCYYEMDARCVSIPEPFNHKSHPHPLYFTLRKGICMNCHKDKERCSWISMMECLECNSFLCLACATLPYEAIYKHDKHPLTLCYGENNTSGIYWCEICEGELDAEMWFYRCQECCNTLHISCVLGEDTNLKPCHNFEVESHEVNIRPNSGNSRPVCETCGLRCKAPQFFRLVGTSDTYCSFYECMYEFTKYLE